MKLNQIKTEVSITKQGINWFSFLTDDDIEDDMKLFDLKQRLTLVKPKFEVMDANVCRCCSNEDGVVGIYDQKDEGEVDLAHKLKIICGIEVGFTWNRLWFVKLNFDVKTLVSVVCGNELASKLYSKNQV